MTWVKVDDTMPEDPRWDIVGAAGLGVHVAALAYCNRNLTDGLLSVSRARRLIECPEIDAVITQLVKVGFWRYVNDEDVQLIDFLVDQPPAEKVRAERAAKAARQARWVERQKATRDASLVASRDGVRDVPPSRPNPPRKERVGEGIGAHAPDSANATSALPRPRVVSR